MNEKHQFALFYKNLSQLLSYKSGGVAQIRDEDLWHRITRVLRLRVGQEVTLFDGSVSACVNVLEPTFSKKETVFVDIIKVETCVELMPHITLMPCLLKKDAFEDIIYAAAQMGVNKVVPVLSDKVHKVWLEKRDSERLESIMIAACEQSKQFVLPKLCEPIKFSEISSNSNISAVKIYFDPVGASFVDLLEKIRADKPAEIILFFGPEGGLTTEEEAALANAQFQTHALTPTILRAREAVIVGLGGVRSAK